MLCTSSCCKNVVVTIMDSMDCMKQRKAIEHQGRDGRLPADQSLLIHNIRQYQYYIIHFLHTSNSVL